MPTKKELKQELDQLKAKISDRARKAVQARWAKMTPEQWQEHRKKHSQKIKNYWAKMTPEEREEHKRKSVNARWNKPS